VATYQVICVNKERSRDGSHEHIAWLGLGDQGGWRSRITVVDALQQLRLPFGDRYVTVSPSTTRQATVIEGACEVCGARPYVRTNADGIHDNNLGQLNLCQLA